MSNYIKNITMIGILNLEKNTILFDEKKFFVKIVENLNENLQIFIDEAMTEKIGAGWFRINLAKKKYIKIVFNLKDKNEYIIGRESSKTKNLFFLEFDRK